MTGTLPQDFTCDRCAHCCRSHRVPLTRADLHRLAPSALLAAKYVEFLSSDDVDMNGEPESFARLSEGRRVLMLRHQEGRTGRGCVFLDATGCSVHERRPLACRTYPYDRPDGGEDLGLVPGMMCPPETGVLTTLRRTGNDSTRAQFVETIRTRDQELAEHALFVEKWNRRQRTRVRLGRAPESEKDFLGALFRDSCDSSEGVFD